MLEIGCCIEGKLREIRSEINVRLQKWTVSGQGDPDMLIEFLSRTERGDLTYLSKSLLLIF